MGGDRRRYYYTKILFFVRLHDSRQYSAYLILQDVHVKITVSLLQFALSCSRIYNLAITLYIPAVLSQHCLLPSFFTFFSPSLSPSFYPRPNPSHEHTCLNFQQRRRLHLNILWLLQKKGGLAITKPVHPSQSSRTLLLPTFSSMRMPLVSLAQARGSLLCPIGLQLSPSCKPYRGQSS